MAWGENDRYSTYKNNALIASKSIAQLTPYPRVFQHNHTITRDGKVLGEKLNSRFEYENRINEYYQVMWERHGTLDGKPLTFTTELSSNLAVEVELFVRMDMINRVPMFQKCSKKVVQEIVMHLHMQMGRVPCE